MRRAGRVAAALVAGLALLAFATKPPSLDYSPATVRPGLPPPDDAPGIVAGAEERIVYAGPDDRTGYVVVHLHGFSASRQESHPLAADVATALGANLYEVRFRGHGLVAEGLANVRAEDWLDDTLRALAAGAALGDKLVVIATSTGASLLTSLFGHPQLDAVHALVFISPNFGARHPAARFMTAPGGRLLLRAVAGETRSWQAQNPAQAKYWTTSYPSAALVEMQRVVDRARSRLGEAVEQPILIVYSRADRVVSPTAIETAAAALRSPRVEVFEVTDTDDAYAHVLVGDILSPRTTADVTQRILDFVRRPAQ